MKCRSLVLMVGVVMVGCGPAVSVGDESGSTGGEVETRGGSESGGPTSQGTTSGDTAPSPASTGTSAGSASETAGPDMDSSTTGDPGSESSVDTGQTSGPTVEPDCEALCTTLAEGSCLSPKQVGGFGCEEPCASTLEGQLEDAHDAFGQCVATNPLCFQSVESCMWGVLYPEPFEQLVSYTGTGYEAYEGMTVRAGISDGEGVLGLTEATVVGGAFTIDITEVLPIENTRLILLHVDTNADGVCTAGLDFGNSESVPVSGDFDAPVFEHSGIAPEASHDFVCDYL